MIAIQDSSYRSPHFTPINKQDVLTVITISRILLNLNFIHSSYCHTDLIFIVKILQIKPSSITLEAQVHHYYPYSLITEQLWFLRVIISIIFTSLPMIKPRTSNSFNPLMLPLSKKIFLTFFYINVLLNKILLILFILMV